MKPEQQKTKSFPSSPLKNKAEPLKRNWQEEITEEIRELAEKSHIPLTASEIILIEGVLQRVQDRQNSAVEWLKSQIHANRKKRNPKKGTRSSSRGSYISFMKSLELIDKAFEDDMKEDEDKSTVYIGGA